MPDGPVGLGMMGISRAESTKLHTPCQERNVRDVGPGLSQPKHSADINCTDRGPLCSDTDLASPSS